MKITSSNNHQEFRIECNREELMVLSNAINNIPQAVSDKEYSSLIGVSKAEATKILHQIHTAFGDDHHSQH
jgi:hypothetical protein